MNRVPSSAQEPKLNFSKIIQISEYDKSDNSQNDLDTFTSQLKSLSSKLISAVEDVCDLHILHSTLNLKFKFLHLSQIQSPSL